MKKDYENLDHYNILMTPQEAEEKLLQHGIDEDSYDLVLNGHPSVQGMTGHELKALVFIVQLGVPQNFQDIYTQVRDQYPQT